MVTFSGAVWRNAEIRNFGTAEGVKHAPITTKEISVTENNLVLLMSDDRKWKVYSCLGHKDERHRSVWNSDEKHSSRSAVLSV